MFMVIFFVVFMLRYQVLLSHGSGVACLQICATRAYTALHSGDLCIALQCCCCCPDI
jgi:hypothetical protein